MGVVKRLWRRRKPEGLQIMGLTDEVEFEIWLTDFRFRVQCYDVEDVFFETENARIVNPEDEEDRKFTDHNVLLSYLGSSYLQLVQQIDDLKE